MPLHVNVRRGRGSEVQLLLYPMDGPPPEVGTSCGSALSTLHDVDVYVVWDRTHMTFISAQLRYEDVSRYDVVFYECPHSNYIRAKFHVLYDDPEEPRLIVVLQHRNTNTAKCYVRTFWTARPMSAPIPTTAVSTPVPDTKAR